MSIADLKSCLYAVSSRVPNSGSLNAWRLCMHIH